MIKNIVMPKKNFEDYISEAIREIPLYCDEWTNFNASDPGMTILENLTAFQIVQGNYIDEMPAKLQGRILDMAGFKLIPQNSSKVLLEALNVTKEFELPANQPFMVGNISFETNQGFKFRPNQIKKIFSEVQGEKREFSSLVRRDIPVTVEPFGGVPQKDDAMYIILDKKPDQERDLIFYFDFEDCKRKISKDEEIDQAKVSWQIYTEKGFVSLAVKDQTASLAHSGELRIKWKGNIVPSLYTDNGENGYCIRCVIETADYDIIPKLKNVYGFLFEVRQKDTLSLCHTYPKMNEILVKNHLMDLDYVQVFCKEEQDNSYQAYKPARVGSQNGRYFEKEVLPDGTHVFRFDEEKYGFGPGKYPDAVKIIAYNEAVMRRYEIGTVYGYDNQVLSIPYKNILRDGFCLLVRRRYGKNKEVVDFVRPDRKGEYELGYSLDEASGKITIYNAGDFIGATIQIGSLCSSNGERGNILPGNTFVPKGMSFPATFVNPVTGKDGRPKETQKERKIRFVTDMSQTGTAVMEKDYERLVLDMPNLLIDRVNAIIDEKRNSVRVVVKPDLPEEFPKLSFSYIKQIQDYLDVRRLVNTKIYVCQPDYLEVNVRGCIYIDKNYAKAKEIIEQQINEYVDYIHGNQRFGKMLEIDVLHKKLEALACVAYVDNLSFVSMNDALGKVVDNDLLLQESVLSYPGQIDIEYIVDIK